jgi:hypothetical protein
MGCSLGPHPGALYPTEHLARYDSAPVGIPDLQRAQQVSESMRSRPRSPIVLAILVIGETGLPAGLLELGTLAAT